jgi:hypothetical protein
MITGRVGHLYDVCRLGQGPACCRYIIGDGNGLHCGKLAKALKALVDKSVEAGTMNARGDNCAGKPIEENL